MPYAYWAKTYSLLLTKDFNLLSLLTIVQYYHVHITKMCKIIITKTLNEKRVRAYMCVTWQTVLLTNEQSQVTLL